MRSSSQSKSLSVLPIPPSRMGNRKRMWNFVHELNKPDANEELERVRRLAYKRVDRDKGESRYLLKWLRPRCPRVAELDEQHQLQLFEKIEVLQYSDNDSYQSTCGVLVRGWMVRNDMPSGEVLGPGACVDCMNEDMKFECWYGADNAAPEEVEREQRQRKMNLLMSAGAFSKALNSITKSTEKWKKKGHARVTEVIAFPVESWNIVRESQRIDNIKQFVEVLKLNSKINILVTYHPVTLENASAIKQTKELLSALDLLENSKIIFTKSNSDTDGRIINQLIDEYVKKNDNCVVYSSLGQLRYLSALKFVDVVVGNSSSGLIEVPSFNKATVNIGDRQKNRIKADSIIDCYPEKDEIVKSIKKSQSKRFQDIVRSVKSPYGEGNSSELIINFLENIDLSNKESILKKQFHDIKF